MRPDSRGKQTVDLSANRPHKPSPRLQGTVQVIGTAQSCPFN